MEPTWRSECGRVALYLGDCLEIMPQLPEVETAITDPPYGWHFMQVSFDTQVPGKEFWSALRLKAGGTLLAFGGPRTWHRLACAIEDAGWEIRDCLMYLFGTGMAKGIDISKAIDREAGAERKVLRIEDRRSDYDGRERNSEALSRGWREAEGRTDLRSMATRVVTEPATEAAKTWEGYASALKPGYEPVIMAMRPLDGTYAQNAIKHGVAGLNIDGARIGYQSEADKESATPQGRCTSKEASAIGAEPDVGRGLERVEFARPVQKGRYPSNLILGHHPDCRCVGSRQVKTGTAYEPEGREQKSQVYGKYEAFGRECGYGDENGLETVEAWECHPDCPVRMLDEQTGELSTSKTNNTFRPDLTAAGGAGIYGDYGKGKHLFAYGDRGGPSRFFYCSKASRSERGSINTHPTVKPVDLLRYLSRLTETPTKGTVIDPFMGSGSMGVAAVLEGRPFIGIEKNPEYFEIARQRIEHALKNPGDWKLPAPASPAPAFIALQAPEPDQGLWALVGE